MTAPELQAREGSVDELFDAWEDAWSDKDQDAFRKLCSPQLHYEDPLTAEPLEGIPALITHAERLWEAFPDARLEQLGPRLSDGRMASAPCKLLATHREPLGGLPATNRFIVMPAVFYCELERGRLLRVRAFFDLYDAAVQLGVLPGRGSLGEKALLMLRGFGLRGGR
ncbi:MAG: ester cyclase [Acidobacteriota bacterium]|nr:ester cyclase [Acidobacteriota bacterium]